MVDTLRVRWPCPATKIAEAKRADRPSRSTRCATAWRSRWSPAPTRATHGLPAEATGWSRRARRPGQRPRPRSTRLRAGGGTAIGRWLQPGQPALRRPTRRGQARHPAHRRPEPARGSGAAPARCSTRARGTSSATAAASAPTGWPPSCARSPSTLLGTADGLEDPAELPAAFRAMTEAAMGKSVADVALRVWTPPAPRLRFVKQVLPAGRGPDRPARSEVSARVGDYPTGAWGAESRDYHVSVEVAAGRGRRGAAAPPGSALVSGGAGARRARSSWPAGPTTTALSTRINPQVAHYTGQAELADGHPGGARRRAMPATSTPPPPSSAAPSSSPPSPATRTPPSCWPRSSTWWTRATGTVRLKKQVGRRRRRDG